MLSRRQRIPSIDLKKERGRIVGRSSYFLVTARENGLPHPRFAVIVGARVAKQAVRRHALKRRAAHVIGRLDVPPRDIVLTVLPAASTLSAEQFRDELRKLFPHPQGSRTKN